MSRKPESFREIKFASLGPFEHPRHPRQWHYGKLQQLITIGKRQQSSIFNVSWTSPVQAQVIEALAQGHTVSAAAEKAGIHRTTIHHWIRNEPQFKAAVRTAQSEYSAELNDGIRELAARALLTLHDLLQDPTTPPALRLKTALAILQRPHAPNTGWHLPDPIELEPAETNHSATIIDAATEPAAPPTQPPAPTPIARCAPCPCGSGRKYKRCCGVEAIGLPVTPDVNPRAA